MRSHTPSYLVLVLLSLGMAMGCTPKTSLPQTDPTTWSKGGWQDLRFGMGPGDVELLLREGKGELAPIRAENLPKMDDPYPTDADSRFVDLASRLPLAGRACVVRLGFYRGRLFYIGISGRFPGPGKGVEDASTAEYRKKEMNAWREGVTGLLRDKYGPPAKVSERETSWQVGPTTIRAQDWGGFLLDSGEQTVDISYQDPDAVKLRLGVNPADKSKL